MAANNVSTRPGRGRAVGRAVVSGATLGIADIRRLDREINANVDVDDAMPVDGLYGQQYSGKPIVLGVMGDSLACGKGATSPENTMAAQMATELAAKEQRPVKVYSVARSGASTRHLPEQNRALKEKLGGQKADVVYMSIGANDVADRVSFSEARVDLRTTVHDLARDGSKVVCSMPDRASAARAFNGKPVIGAVADRMMGSRARQQAQFLDKMRTEGGFNVRAVNTTALTTQFKNNPGFTSSDGFHPSDAGQRATAVAVVGDVQGALRDPMPAHPDPARRQQPAALQATPQNRYHVQAAGQRVPSTKQSRSSFVTAA